MIVENKIENFELRNWQDECVRKALKWYTSQSKYRQFVMNVAPASGKTKTACVIASELYKRNLIDRTIVIAPFTGVTLQWSEDFKDIVNRNMEKISSVEDISYTSFDTDICATWSALANIQDNIDLICKKQKTFVVCDEHHHAAVEAAWGESANSAFRNAKYCLILTGTPFRTDGKDCTWFNKGALNDN